MSGFSRIARGGGCVRRTVMTSSSPGRAQRTALRARCPLSRAGKEIILDDDTTNVGVDPVLSADVGDAPMRQRQYTARVEAPCAWRPELSGRTCSASRAIVNAA